MTGGLFGPKLTDTTKTNDNKTPSTSLFANTTTNKTT